MDHWIDRAPDHDGRISMAVTGVLAESHWDGALAYLVMCRPDQVQVMCVTYQPQPVTGAAVTFAGGFVPAEGRRVILDPCLASPADAGGEAN